MQSTFLKRVWMFVFGLAMSHAVIYLAYSYATWDFNAGNWTIQARVTAAFCSWVFGVMAGIVLAIEGVE